MQEMDYYDYYQEIDYYIEGEKYLCSFYALVFI